MIIERNIPQEKPILAVCGKGGVGKTAFSALLSRVLIDAGITPLLLIDADPTGGLTSAIGESVTSTLASVRDRLITSARQGEKVNAERVANQLDYFVLEALVERKNYSLLAMGHSLEKGCFCPANELLRGAIDLIVSAFSAVLIDAEPGIEQINRDVTRRVTRVITVLDGSQRSIETLRLIADMGVSAQISVVANRVGLEEVGHLPEGKELIGMVPENQTIRQFDREGRSLWELPADNEAMAAVHHIAHRLNLLNNTQKWSLQQDERQWKKR